MRPPRRRRRKLDVVVAGGGTGGHVVPAIAVARALVAAGHSPESILFVGSRRGMEAELVPAAGFEVELLPGRGIVRRIGAAEMRANVLALSGLLVAGVRSLVLLAGSRPSCVVMVGGYAGAPVSLAAALLRVPLVVVNLDAVPGAANRLAGRFAAACAVALPGTELPRAVVTGVPLRPEVAAARDAGRAKARAALGLPPGASVVAVAGGSLGARRLNDAAVGLARLLRDRAPARAGATSQLGEAVVYHLTGRRDHERVLHEVGDLDPSGYRAVAFEERLPELLVACDLVVSRAGASIVAELCALGVASVLVPLPGAPADHQRRNAEVLAGAGAAVVLADGECTPERLAVLVGELLGDNARRKAMSAAAASLAVGDAAARIAALVEEKGHRR